MSLPVAGSFRIISDECSAWTMVILTPGKGSIVPPLLMRGTSLAGMMPSVSQHWLRPAGAHIGALLVLAISMASPR